MSDEDYIMPSNLLVRTSDELADEEIEAFNDIWALGFSNFGEPPINKELIGSRDLHFFLEDENRLPVAVGRYRYVEGILIDDVEWTSPVWGRADIAVDTSYQKQGYGKELVVGMIDYAKANSMVSCVGFSGKNTSLPDFYKKCGLEINMELGEKLYRVKKGVMSNLSHVAVSHFKDDPFIEAAIKSNRVQLPFSW